MDEPGVVNINVNDGAGQQQQALAVVTEATSFDLFLQETVGGRVPPDQTSFEVTAHENGVVIGSVRFVGSVLSHKTVGTVAQTVFARLPDGFVLVEQTPTRCVVMPVETEEALLRLLGPAAAALFPCFDANGE